MIPYTPNRTFWSETVGYNYEWSNIQAALALAQLMRLPELLRIKKKIFDAYAKLIEKIPGVTMNPAPRGSRQNYWLPTILLDRAYKIRKETLLKEFEMRGIAARPFFYPMSMMPAFKHYVRGNERKRNPVSYSVSSRGVSLPSAYSLTEKDIRRTVAAFKEILSSKHG